jgi:hypothetical protein
MPQTSGADGSYGIFPIWCSHTYCQKQLALPYLKDLFGTFGAIHLSLYPLYFPWRNSAWLRYVFILATAILKTPFFLVRQYVAHGPQRWEMAAKAWTYWGTLLHWRAGYERIRWARAEMEA